VSPPFVADGYPCTRPIINAGRPTAPANGLFRIGERFPKRQGRQPQGSQTHGQDDRTAQRIGHATKEELFSFNSETRTTGGLKLEFKAFVEVVHVGLNLFEAVLEVGAGVAFVDQGRPVVLKPAWPRGRLGKPAVGGIRSCH
jgi:hypothetical protein